MQLKLMHYKTDGIALEHIGQEVFVYVEAVFIGRHAFVRNFVLTSF